MKNQYRLFIKQGLFITLTFIFMLQSVGLANPSTDNFATTVPDSARLIGTFGGMIGSSTVKGEHAFLAQADRLIVFDLQSNTSVASLKLPSSVQTQCLSDDYLYLSFAAADYRGRLMIVDVSNPISPTIVSHTEILAVPDYIHQIQISNGKAYLATGPDFRTRTRFTTVDVSTPTVPVKMGSYDISVLDFFITGNYAYVIEGSISGPDTNRVAILDLSDNNDILINQRIDMPYARGMDCKGNYAYIAFSSSADGMKIYDVSDPTDPQLESTFVHEGRTFVDVIVDTDRAYIQRTYTRIIVVDISDKANPGFLGEHRFQSTFMPLGVLGESLYGQYSGQFMLADFSDVQNPILTLPYNSPIVPRGMAVGGNQLFTITENLLYTYDLNDPATPVLNDTLAQIWGNKVFAKNNILGVANWSKDLTLYDISGATPVELGVYEAGATVIKMGFRGDYAYILTFLISGGSPQQCWFEVVNITNPSAPVRSGNLMIDGQGKDMFIPTTGNLAYITLENEAAGGRLLIIDTSSPDAPAVLSTMEVEQNPISIVVRDTTLFVGKNHTDNNYGILDVYSVSDSTAPRFLQEFIPSQESNLSDLIWLDNYLLIGLADLGVYTYGYDFETREFSEGPSVQVSLPLILGGYMPQNLGKRQDEAKQYTYVMRGSASHYGPEDYGKYGISIIELWPQPTYTQPTLSIGLASGMNIPTCPPEPGEELKIANGSITALKENWTVNTVIFTAEGMCKIEHIKKASLTIAGREITGQVVADGTGNISVISFPIGEHITEGESLPYQLSYDFYFESKSDTAYLPCPFDEVLYCGVSVNANQVNAEPDNNPPGVKLPVLPIRLYSPQTVIASVWNISHTPQLPFTGIQEAVDDVQTIDGHSLRVCPGLYTENVDVDKSLTIKSVKGRNLTFVSGLSNQDHVFHITKGNTEISGFTITDAFNIDDASSRLAGIYVDSTASSIKIYDNRINGNDNGIFLYGEVVYNSDYISTPTKAEIVGNLMSLNACGIKMLKSGENLLRNNNISGNSGNGIEVIGGEGVDGASWGLNTIVENRISKNQNGIMILASGRNNIRDNIVKNNENNGLDLDENSLSPAGGNIFTGNVVNDNKGHGFRINKTGQLGYQQHLMKITNNHFRANGKNGLFLEHCYHFEVRVDSNEFCQNTDYGIELNKIMYIHLESNKVDSNKTGLYMLKCKRNEIFGNSFNANEEYGIYTESGLMNEFHHENKMNDNIIHGIHFYKEAKSTIKEAEVSRNLGHGVFVKSSERMFIEESVIEFNQGAGLVGKTLPGVFFISDCTIRENYKQGVIIDTARTLYKEHGYFRDNDISLNKMSGIEINNSNFTDIKKCKVGANYVHGIRTRNSDHIEVNFCKILGNMEVGVFLEDAGFYTSSVESNDIWYNGTGVKLIDCTVGVFDNSIRKSGSNTGIHLYNSNAAISGNSIFEDDGDGIACENGSQPQITGNNIYANLGMGVNNHDGAVIVSAGSNWWGDASGPGGLGNGSGDEISDNVDFAGWLTQPITLTTRVKIDTVHIPVGSSDSIYCNFQNQDDLAGGVNVHLSDTQGWLTDAADLSETFEDSLGIQLAIPITVPVEAAYGSESMVKVEAASQTNPAQTAKDSFLVIVYQQHLSRIDVKPDSVFLSPGETRQFEVSGYDTLNRAMAVGVRWTAHGGTVDSVGFFTAGADSGLFHVTAEDTLRLLTDLSVIRIGTYTDVDKDQVWGLPTEFALHQNYPNPFNPRTTIRFNVKERCQVTLIIYDIVGRKVATLVDEEYNPGFYEVQLNAQLYSTGIYIYRIRMKEFTDSKKMIIVR
ncbi:right-handed parallel beta-helix repeat-containing protein [bacterium]|nr:right-handed parallel beta-helix repeat-containing protein [bacterium]